VSVDLHVARAAGSVAWVHQFLVRFGVACVAVVVVSTATIVVANQIGAHEYAGSVALSWDPRGIEPRSVSRSDGPG
jgi:hypothetical protein